MLIAERLSNVDRLLLKRELELLDKIESAQHVKFNSSVEVKLSIIDRDANSVLYEDTFRSDEVSWIPNFLEQKYSNEIKKIRDSYE